MEVDDRIVFYFTNLIDPIHERSSWLSVLNGASPTVDNWVSYRGERSSWDALSRIQIHSDVSVRYHRSFRHSERTACTSNHVEVSECAEYSMVSPGGAIDKAADSFWGDFTPHPHECAAGYLVPTFTFNYDAYLSRVSSQWANSWRIESRVAALSCGLVHLKDTIWAFEEKLHVGNFESSTGIPPFQDIWRSLLSNAEWSTSLGSLVSACVVAASAVANVVYRAHSLLRGLCKRVSLLRLELRWKCASSKAPCAQDRIVVERRFFSTHGFHPPDLELPVQLLSRLPMGYVPGLLPA